MTAIRNTPCDVLEPGTPVEVRNRFDGDWGVGFEVVSCDGSTVRVRRARDGFVLPVEFGLDEVRVPHAGAGVAN